MISAVLSLLLTLAAAWLCAGATRLVSSVRL